MDRMLLLLDLLLLVLVVMIIIMRCKCRMCRRLLVMTSCARIKVVLENLVTGCSSRLMIMMFNERANAADKHMIVRNMIMLKVMMMRAK